jgi:PEP-CTERM motif
MLRATLGVGLLGMFAMPAAAQVTVGTWDGSGNCFPFGCDLGFPSTYYQQVYSASAFSNAGFITGLDFFIQPDFQYNLNTMNFTMSLSTTSLGLNVDGSGGISSSNPDANLGADNALFGNFSISGAAPSTLSFTGVPFYYDPALGNLLLDIRVTSLTGADPSLRSFYQEQQDAPLFSRATDFGTEFEGVGLVTQFDYGPVPEPGTMTLLATGLAGMAGAGWRRRKRSRA